MTPKVLVFPGSVRSGSFNASLADAAARELAVLGADVTRLSLGDYPLPIMDEDLQAREGIPENAMKLGRQIAHHDAVFVACPEYNSSIPPLLKNAIDWVSRISKDGDRALKPWKGTLVALGSASNGRFAGARGLYHVRSVMMNVGAEVVTAQCSIGAAAKAFDASGTLIDERAAAALATTCRALVEQSRWRGMR
ncbi:NADPH-dependent FMN reductase [Pararhizobium haloflavum]|uniref:NADPH-dependent FMN reductase n=1 Tax=Pararhizobium haloflavum TaxID=2037914 RepID=UPI000C1765D0|nr:NAD(P)H-dependent oxidoreductase [Pararhizobium haloflavum]